MPSKETLVWAIHHSLISTSETTKLNLAMAMVLVKDMVELLAILDLVAANKRCEVYFALSWTWTASSILYLTD
jgi:hypothetical protein